MRLKKGRFTTLFADRNKKKNWRAGAADRSSSSIRGVTTPIQAAARGRDMQGTRT